MAETAILPVEQPPGTIAEMPESDDEATQVMLEALFDIKIAVFEIQRALFGEGDEEEETEEDA